MLYDILLMGAPADGQANPIAMFLPLILIFIVFYFFIIRPQKKKEDQRKKMIEAVKKGDRIVTIGGVHGTVTQVDETSVLVQVDSNTKLRIEKNAIATVVSKDGKE
ncbi:MAG: preprotein translocase subunit YajC [Bacteroidetes bacterium]|nr:MAG: preprotein translocase subunit YajC [Bacteroidota bacterium]GIV58570.1 MAG: preprotein translocase subunit YajC [Rhodothermaceae bacterium]